MGRAAAPLLNYALRNAQQAIYATVSIGSENYDHQLVNDVGFYFFLIYAHSQTKVVYQCSLASAHMRREKRLGRDPL